MTTSLPTNMVSQVLLDLSAAIEDPQQEEVVRACLMKAKAQTVSVPSLHLLHQAVSTWSDVWPRLGTQQEFRIAVSREARAWAQRFSTMG